MSWSWISTSLSSVSKSSSPARKRSSAWLTILTFSRDTRGLSLPQPLHDRRRGRAEAELLVEAVGVVGAQDPADARVGPVLNGLAHELHPEPSAAEVGVHVHVGEIGEDRAVRHHSAEPGLAPVLVEPDHQRCLPHKPLRELARAALGPVGVLGEEARDLVDIHPRAVVVELEAAFELSSHYFV